MTIAARAPQTSAWATPAFRCLLRSEAVSLSGSAVSTIALPALAVLELDATAGQVAVLAFLGQLPSMLALWAGALSDRYAKRLQLIVADVAAAAALATVPAAALTGVLTIGQLYVVMLVLGAAKVQHDAAAISLLPGIVAPHLLHDANAKLGAASSVADSADSADSAGSNAGAALVGVVGPARSVLADVASFLISALLVWHIRTPPPPTHPVRQHGLRRDIAEGVRYVIGQPTIRILIAALATLSFGLAIMSTYWAYYLLTALGASPTTFGLIMGAGGTGSLVGALFAPRIAARLGVGWTIITGFAVSPLAQVPLLLAGSSRGWQIVLAGTLAVQLFWATAAGTSQRSLRQILCDARFQGRMQAASTTVTAGSRPLAAATAGALALLLDVRAVLIIGALLQVVPVVLLLASPVRVLRDMPAPPDAASVPPAREGA
ncbi:MFS transporter [Streptomyces sp. NPDC093984]|uniref:MFS transporter n=1 Tax=Streptomyces sp. NPDC093984 TaxID=3366052 RepID=UPI003830C3B2